MRGTSGRVVVGTAIAVLLLATGCGEEGGAVAVVDAEAFVEPDTGERVVDADVLATGEAIADSASQGLTVAQVAGGDDVWPPAQRQALTYCVDVAGFGGAARMVQAALSLATADWERSAGVRFVHLAAEDAHCTAANGRVLFDVRLVSGRPYLARSFFPSSPRRARELLVDREALTPPSPLTLAGILKHELGHVLGLRHEHTRKRTNPCYEDGAWRAVTPYDRKSVMHYPQCAGVTGKDLLLTALDRQGIRQLYP